MGKHLVYLNICLYHHFIIHHGTYPATPKRSKITMIWRLAQYLAVLYLSTTWPLGVHISAPTGANWLPHDGLWSTVPSHGARGDCFPHMNELIHICGRLKRLHQKERTLTIPFIHGVFIRHVKGKTPITQNAQRKVIHRQLFKRNMTRLQKTLTWKYTSVVNDHERLLIPK